MANHRSADCRPGNSGPAHSCDDKRTFWRATLIGGCAPTGRVTWPSGVDRCWMAAASRKRSATNVKADATGRHCRPVAPWRLHWRAACRAKVSLSLNRDFLTLLSMYLHFRNSVEEFSSSLNTLYSLWNSYNLSSSIRCHISLFNVHKTLMKPYKTPLRLTWPTSCTGSVKPTHTDRHVPITGRRNQPAPTRGTAPALAPDRVAPNKRQTVAAHEF
jgi:hypothetical protein